MAFLKDLRTNSNEVIEKPSINTPKKASQNSESPKRAFQNFKRPKKASKNSKRPKKAGYPKVYKNRPKKANPNSTRKAPKNISKTFLKVKKEIAQTKVIDKKKILTQLEKLLKDFSRNSSFKDQRGEKMEFFCEMYKNLRPVIQSL